MKRFYFLLLLFFLLSCSNESQKNKQNSANFFKLASAVANFSARFDHQTILFDNKMWIIAGFFNNDVWYSDNGTIWTQANISAEFSTFTGHSAVVFNNKIWVLGGHSATQKKNDVWYSSDGLNWKCATRSAAFSQELTIQALFSIRTCGL